MFLEASMHEYISFTVEKNDLNQLQVIRDEVKTVSTEKMYRPGNSLHQARSEANMFKKIY